MSESKIRKFYEFSSVFVTGGTGFMGRILIEKLLRSTKVSTIYILVRNKRGKNVSFRLDEVFNDVVFDRLRQERPNFRDRIEVISGDCCSPDLGMSMEDKQKLISSTHIVFHLAATVNFTENLATAYQVNVIATSEMLDLIREMKKLKAFMHVSTAYANFPLGGIEEKIHDFPMPMEELASLMEKFNTVEIETVTPSILGAWPNTYTFTKAMAEQLIKNCNISAPIGIFRPSIILSTYNEPIPGWLNNQYGPNGVTIGYVIGLLKVMTYNPDCIADIIPVDTCVNALIASAWDVSRKKFETIPASISVYNYVSGSENPITWGDYVFCMKHFSEKWPYSKSSWLTFFLNCKNGFWLLVCRFIFHVTPAALHDIFSILSGNNAKMLRFVKKKHASMDQTNKFSMRTFHFTNENTMNLWNNMEETDKKLFPMNMANINWWKFLENQFRGVRKYILKDPESNIEEARKRYKRLRLYEGIVIAVLIYIVCFGITMVLSEMYDFIFG